MAGNASTRDKNKYAASNYDSLRIVVPKGSKAIIKAAAEQATGGSINGYVKHAINEQLKKDGFTAVQKPSEEADT